MVRTTREQRRALKNLFDRGVIPIPNSGGKRVTYMQFRRSILPAFGGDAIMVRWHTMWIGIEQDGYTHS